MIVQRNAISDSIIQYYAYGEALPGPEKCKFTGPELLQRLAKVDHMKSFYGR